MAAVIGMSWPSAQWEQRRIEAGECRGSDARNAARDKAEDEELRRARPFTGVGGTSAAAGGEIRRHVPIGSRAPRIRSRYAQGAEDKYMCALEAPQMAAAFHAGGTLELTRRAGEEKG